MTDTQITAIGKQLARDAAHIYRKAHEGVALVHEFEALLRRADRLLERFAINPICDYFAPEYLYAGKSLDLQFANLILDLNDLDADTPVFSFVLEMFAKVLFLYVFAA